MSMSSSHSGVKHQAELFDFVAHHSRDAIFLAAPNGEIFFANRSASLLFGYSLDDFLSHGLSLISESPCFPETAHDVEINLSSFSQRAEWLRHKNGHRFRAEINFTRFQVGELERLVIVIHELSRQNGSEYGQRAGEKLVADAPVMIYVTDAEWRILWANDNKSVGSGFSIPELMGKQSPLRSYLGENRPQTLAEIERDLSQHGEWSGELYSRRKNGEVYPIWASVSIVKGLQPGTCNRIVMLTDVAAIQETERVLRQISLYDLTTGLPNREFFEQETTKALGYANPEKSTLYILLLDIDSFGMVNQALGHEIGDLVLNQFATRLQNVVGANILLSRHTSDTFAVLAKGEDSPEDIAAFSARIRQALHEPLALDEHKFNLSVSIGVSSYPEDGKTCGELLRAADVALQHARYEGGNGYKFYRSSADALSRRFIKLATPIRIGLQRGEFTAFFQPIVDSRTGKTVSMESLARWQRPDGSLVSPADFIPVAERSGAIRGIFEAVLLQTCRTIRELDESGHKIIDASINLSARQLLDPDISEKIIEGIHKQGVEPARIHLEITESLLMKQPEDNSRILEMLQRAGIKIVIDEFGVGYSSFSYLKNFHVDGIKLDRIFVKDIPGDKKDETIVAMMLSMGNELDIPMVAEGVETLAQANFLREHGCDRLQGFLFTQPLPGREFVDKFMVSEDW